MKYPKLLPQYNGTFMLLEQYNIKGYTVPYGFVTDGLTLKTRLLRLVVDKYQPKFAPFFVLHDYLCSIDKYKEADEVGEQVLFSIENSLRTKLMMWFIRAYHKVKYNV